MFTDYAVCVFISLGITALAMAVYGIGHLLKRTATALVKFLQFKDLPVEIAV